MEKITEKPWYHGVKWERKALGGISTVLCNEKPRGDLGIPAYGYDKENGYCVAYPFRFERAISEGGGFEIRMDFVSFGHREAELIAAAPETAAERDNLKQVNERLVEALELFLKEYIELVESGDAGFWDADREPKVITARSALKAAQNQKDADT